MGKRTSILIVLVVLVSAGAYWVLSRDTRRREALEEAPIAAPSSTSSASTADSAATPVVVEEIRETDSGTRATELTTGPVTSVTTRRTVLNGDAAMRGWDMSLGVNQYSGSVTGSEVSRPFTQVLGEVRLRPSSRLAIGLGEEIKKLYEIEAQGEDEFLLSDPVAFVDYKVLPTRGGGSVTASAATSLPVTRRSREENLVTRTSVALEFRQAMLRDRLRVSLTPAAAYRVNQFASGKDRSPLERAEVSGTANLEVALNDSIVLGAWGRPRAHFFEQYDDRDESPASRTEVDFGTYLNLGLTTSLRAEVGLSRGTSALRSIRYSEFFYDPSAPRAYAGLQLTL